MFKKLIIAALAAGLVFGPLPAGAKSFLDALLAQVEQADGEPMVASLDKEKPSKREKGEKEATGREKEGQKKKDYDDFRDKNGNGIDDRFERKEPPKRKKKEPGEVNL